MQLHTRIKDGIAQVEVAGELDLAAGRKLDEELRRLVAEGVDRVRLDLSDCTFIDSSGIGVLLRWREDSEDRGREFEVTGVRGAVRRIFQVTGVLQD